MEATPIKLVGIIGTALLSLILAAPVYAQQEQHDQEEQKEQKEQTAKPAQDEKKGGNSEVRKAG